VTTATREHSLASPTRPLPTGAVTWAAFVVVVLAYLPSWLRFPIVWMENRSYGFLAAGLCIWLVWKHRKRITYEGDVASAAMPFFAAGISLVWLAAMALGVQVLQLALLPFVLLLWIGGVFGPAALRLTAPIAVIFLLGVPVWEVFAGVLQAMTAFANGLFVSLTSIRAVVEGNYIRFPFGTIEVAESCSGLSYFMTALTISTAYGQIVLDEWRARFAAIVLATTLAIVANWCRVFGLVVIGSYSRMQSPLMAEHGTYGWLVFCVALAGFFLFAGRLERYDAHLGRRRKHSAGIVAEQPYATDAGLNPFRSGRLAIATASALIGPLCYLLIGAIPAQKDVDPAIAGVSGSASWVQLAPAQRRALWSPAFLGASDQRTSVFARGDQQVQIDRFIYPHQSQGTELISSVNAIAPVGELLADRYIGPLDDRMRLVRQAVVRTPGGFRLVWYWYRVAGVSTPNPTKAKLLEFVSFVRRGPPSEMIAVSTTCLEAGCPAALSALRYFVTGGEDELRGAP